jgi:hypothetical protein
MALALRMKLKKYFPTIGNIRVAPPAVMFLILWIKATGDLKLQGKVTFSRSCRAQH